MSEILGLREISIFSIKTMIFKCSVEIHQPKEKVAAYFANPKFLGEYQDGFLRKELIKGNEGQEGAISKMYYQQGGRSLEIKETIVKNQLPDFFEGHYHHIHMDNTMKCTFTALGENLTRYDSEIEYTRMSWVMPRLMSIFIPSVFKRQAEKWMWQFKEFLEERADGL